MVFLFRSGSLQEKIKLILKATRTHATNLAKYATVYKTTMYILKHLGANPGKEGHFDTFFAGLLGGYLVFGRRTKHGNISSISKQIVIFGKWNAHSCCKVLTLFRSIRESVSIDREAVRATPFRTGQVACLVTTDITRCMACICGIELGSCYVAVQVVP